MGDHAVAEETRFGWTITAQSKEIDYTALLLTEASQSDYEELCRLDVLGLSDSPEHDQQEVHAEFLEQLVRREDGRYETGLPWKGNHPPPLFQAIEQGACVSVWAVNTPRIR